MFDWIRNRLSGDTLWKDVDRGKKSMCINAGCKNVATTEFSIKGQGLLARVCNKDAKQFRKHGRTPYTERSLQ